MNNYFNAVSLFANVGVAETYLKNIGINDVSEIDSILLTSATELEFWVNTPEDKAARAQGRKIQKPCGKL